MAKLVGGVAQIKVGAATETEMKEKKARVEDAMHATKAAVEEGIVPGGGVALVRCIPALHKLKGEGDAQIGINIVTRALEEPLRMIVANAGHEGAVVVEKVKSNNNQNYRLQCGNRELRRPGCGGRYRPDQGHARRAPERCLHCFVAPHHRSAGQRIPRQGREGSGRPSGRHGRRDVLEGAA